ncbi:MAG: primosomal protein N' [Candidatus Poribacteria bacterium]|nr:MAG: primosomal protein N' [Candidatus Poribacteria bacterium]
MKPFADVAVPVPVEKTFTYAVPESLRPWAQVGCRVLVPFSGRTLEGVIVGLKERPPAELSRLRELTDLLETTPFFDEELLELCRWIADRYLCGYGEALRAAIPGGLRVLLRRRVFLQAGAKEAFRPDRAPVQARIVRLLQQRDGQTVSDLRRAVGSGSFYVALSALEAAGSVRVVEERGAQVKARRITVAFVSESLRARPEQVDSTLTALRSRAPKQAALLTYLLRLGEAVPVPELLRATGGSRSVLEALRQKGLVEIRQQEVDRTPSELEEGESPFSPRRPLALTPHQQAALSPILEAIRRREFGCFLLHGVTGSGKTEVYLQAIERVLERGEGALLLVPEISLTPQTAERLSARFGEQVAVLHSRLSDGERFDEWRRVRRGEARIVVGPRSAVFAPIPRLGLIVVDEEHEPTYKQEDPAPRYHAREVARHRAERLGIPLVLGSATPSLESFHAAQVGRAVLLPLPERVEELPLPPVTVVDMRQELQAGNRSIFSRLLQTKIEERLERGEQVLLFLNRRGFSTYVFCRDCGEAERCPDCHISLTYHRDAEMLLCHHCGYLRAVPRRCSRCGSERVRHLGVGTQQVEALARERFPDARVARMDADTTRTKGSHQRILQAFRRGEVDLLIGTQMIAKGLDFPNLTLVGVILSELTLHLPDFRAGERTFQLLAQVAGRSGRSRKGGEVIFQTYEPEHYSVQAAARHDYQAFARQELAARERYGYPPFAHALRVLLRGEEEQETARAAHWLLEELSEELPPGEPPRYTVRGPAPAPLSRVRGVYRWHLLLLAQEAETLQEAGAHLRAALSRCPYPRVQGILDRDPMGTL